VVVISPAQVTSAHLFVRITVSWEPSVLCACYYRNFTEVDLEIG
jgi:hypothetical protein